MALNLKGFVLLELMIGLSILAIIISASYQVITGLDQYNQALNNHESKVITTMNQVQRSGSSIISNHPIIVGYVILVIVFQGENMVLKSRCSGFILIELMIAIVMISLILPVVLNVTSLMIQKANIIIKDRQASIERIDFFISDCSWMLGIVPIVPQTVA